MVMFKALVVVHHLSRRVCDDILKIVEQCFATPPLTMKSIDEGLQVQQLKHKSFVVCPSCGVLHEPMDGSSNRQCHATKGEVTCSELLLTTAAQNDKGKKFAPKLTYAYNSLISQLKMRLREPGFEDELEAWRDKLHQPAMHGEFTNGEYWRTFRDGETGELFFRPSRRSDKKMESHGDSKRSNDRVRGLEDSPLDDSGMMDDNVLTIGLGLNCDWFLLYSRMQYSLGVLMLYIMNLPAAIRHKQHNTFVVGIMPHNKAPTDAYNEQSFNNYLKPLVDDLLLLWKGVRIVTPKYPGGRLVRAVISVIIADLPAIKKLLGSLSYNGLNGCHFCKVKFGWLGDESRSSADAEDDEDDAYLPEILDDNVDDSDNEEVNGTESDDDDNNDVQREEKEERRRVNRQPQLVEQPVEKKEKPKRDYLGAIHEERTMKEVNEVGEQWQSAESKSQRRKVASAGAWKNSELRRLVYTSTCQRLLCLILCI